MCTGKLQIVILLLLNFLFVQIRFVVSDFQGHVLNSWNPANQNLAYVRSQIFFSLSFILAFPSLSIPFLFLQIQNQLGLIGVPGVATRPLHAENSVVPGLQAAVDSICQCTDVQHEKRTSLCENASKVCSPLEIVIKMEFFIFLQQHLFLNVCFLFYF